MAPFVLVCSAVLLLPLAEGFRFNSNNPIISLQSPRRSSLATACSTTDDNDASVKEVNTIQSSSKKVDTKSASTPMFFTGDSNLSNSRADEDFGFDITRFISYNLLAVFIALGSNFLGVTTALMSNTNPEYFRSKDIDQLYSINGYRRAANTEDRYEFIFPENWVIDQSIFMNKLRTREMPTAMQTREKMGSIKPDLAYGPPASDGKENLSVVKSSVMPGFTLQMLGAPKEAAERLLKDVIAPPASGKTFELINSYSDTRNGLDAYTFEYTVRKEAKVKEGEEGKRGPPSFFQHAISVIVSRGTELYTFTATAPEGKWSPTEKKLLEEAAKSFELGNSNVPVGFY